MPSSQKAKSHRRLFLSALSASGALLSVTLAGCGSLLRPSTPTASPVAAAPQPLSQQNRQDVVLQAMAMLDRNYSYGGKKLHTGFDCSGFVSFVYKESARLRLSGSAADLAKQTRAIDKTQAQPGDLVFFNTLGSAFSHVGIYIGDDKFIHAENERTGVKTSNMSSRYWAQRFEGFRGVY